MMETYADNLPSLDDQAFSLAELIDQTQHRRQPVSTAQRQALQQQYAIRQELLEETLQTTRAITQPDDGSECCSRALRVERREAALARFITEELGRIEQDGTTVVAPVVIDDLLNQLTATMTQRESVQHRIETFTSYATDLHQIVRELLFKTHVGPAKLQNLARRLHLDVDAEALDVLKPHAAWSLESRLTEIEWRSEPAVYAAGIQTAALLAFAAPRMFGWTDRTELLVIAALLQDVGLLLLERQYGLPATQLAADEPASYRQHPVVSASLVGALKDYAVDLPVLIAQHHERCDGTGFPAGDKADRLAAPSRLLSIAVRFVELTNDAASSISPGMERLPKQQDAHSLAASHLLREAAQGELDNRLTESFLTALGLSIDRSNPRGRHFQVTSLGGRRFRHDDAENSSAERPAADNGTPQTFVKAPHSEQPGANSQSTANLKSEVQR